MNQSKNFSVRKFQIVRKYLAISVVIANLASCSPKTSQDLENQRAFNVDRDISWAFEDIELPDHPLSLDEVIGIALCRNLDLMAKEQDVAIQHEIATGEKLKMLPNLLINGDVSQRDRGTGSYSQSLLPNVPPAPPSVSSEKHDFRWDSTFTWNLLNFGVAYLRSRQEVNKVLMECLKYQRLRQNLILEITQHFTKAAAMKQAIELTRELEAKSKHYRSLREEHARNKLIPVIEGLKDEQRLLSIQLEIQAYQKDYISALGELKNKMGLPPYVDLQLEPPHLAPPVIPGDVRLLESLALTNRPELYSGDLEEEVRSEEIRTALLQLLPGAELYASENYDSNKFLLNNNWLTIGLRASYNLFLIPQTLKQRDIAKERRKQARLSRIALSLSVISQVNLSYLTYFTLLNEYELSYKTYLLAQKIVEAAKRERALGKMADIKFIALESEANFAEVNLLKAHVDLQNSLEFLNNAMGLPRFFRENEEISPVMN